MSGMYCSTGFMKCADDKCIPEYRWCNGIDNCNDKSDEMKDVCQKWSCPKGTWQCHNKHQCIPLIRVCDSRKRCKDKSDESAHLCKNWTCPEGWSKCRDNSPFSISLWIRVLKELCKYPANISLNHGLKILVPPPQNL